MSWSPKSPLEKHQENLCKAALTVTSPCPQHCLGRRPKLITPHSVAWLGSSHLQKGTVAEGGWFFEDRDSGSDDYDSRVQRQQCLPLSLQPSAFQSRLSVCQPLFGDYEALFVHLCVYSINICTAEESVGTKVMANSELNSKLPAFTPA